MKTNKIIAVMAAITIMAGILAGCGAKDTTVSKEKTIYSRIENGQTIYLTKENTDVQGITKTIKGFAEETSNADYKTIRGDEGYNFLTAELNNQLIKDKQYESDVKFARDNQIITKYAGSEVTSVKIDGANTIATIKTEYTLLNATPDYLQSKNKGKGTVQTLEYKLKLREIKGVWQISAIGLNQ